MNKEITENKKEFFPGTLHTWEKNGNTGVLYCNNKVVLHITVLSPHIIRFRFSLDGYVPKDFSYAPDPAFAGVLSNWKMTETPGFVHIQTEAINCRISKKGLHTSMFDLKGKLLLEDDKGFHWEEGEWGNPIVQMSKRAQPEESYFGLGDKSCHLNLRGERLQNWVTDCFGYTSTTDPLYRSIPFYFGLNDGRAYGIFFDNSFRTYFDFAKEREDATSFWAHGGEMNYYFIYGPELISVAEKYTLLTGRPELPPLWALGFHQCKWSYYPESTVRNLAAEFRSRKIPCDAIYLDIDYMDGYRCFTWNHTHFPDPAGMIADLEKDGFKTVVIIDPGIKIDPHYKVFTEAFEKDYFCRRSDGPYVKGDVWPGECYFPDFTRPEVRTWWAGLFRDLIRRMGVRGVWNDMNEPAIFDVPSKTFPEDVRHDYDGNPTSHRKAHNVYGMQMSRASYEGVKHYGYPRRPFLITRATYAGGQRFASVWTGDNVASWEHLQLASVQSQRLSISGFSHVGSDVGGFNDIPDGQLFVRWLQLGVFHPLYRVHSIGHNATGDSAIDETAVAENIQSGKKIDQEPWSFGEEYTALARKAIELRYQLIPHIYTAFWQYSLHGTPILRPLSFLDQNDPETLHRMEEFCLGDHLLVCPISEENAEGRYLYLPEGIWYDFHTNQPIPGEQEIWTDVTLADIPMYVRAGGVIPMAPVMQYIGERPVDEITLHVYYKNGEEKSTLYTDAGDGYDYLEGKYLVHNFRVSGESKKFTLSQFRNGAFHPSYDHFRVVFHGLPYKSQKCTVDGNKTEISFTSVTTEVIVPWNFESVTLS
ncbi:MAG: glycoside hydrolase family 31 protein [Bacteroidia bacterium]|nr:glycoside hydrolase family 31 protein [Bacteroidia bacterium]